MGGVETVAAAVRADLAARLPSQNKKQREGLALLVATVLDVRSVNLMELAAAVPRPAERLDMRYQWTCAINGSAGGSATARQRAHRCRSRDGALRARGSGARLRRLLRPRGDHRPEQDQRHPSQGDGVTARGRARPASGLAREDARRD